MIIAEIKAAVARDRERRSILWAELERLTNKEIAERLPNGEYHPTKDDYDRVITRYARRSFRIKNTIMFLRQIRGVYVDAVQYEGPRRRKKNRRK